MSDLINNCNYFIYFFIAWILYILKYFFNRSRYYPPLWIMAIIFKSLHRISFSSSSLSISHYSSIESLQCWHHSISCGILINLFLSIFLIIYIIKWKCMHLIWIWIIKIFLQLIRINEINIIIFIQANFFMIRWYLYRRYKTTIHNLSL